MPWVVPLMLTAAALPPVECSTLSGKRHTGRLHELTETTLIMTAQDGGQQKLPLSEVMRIRFPDGEPSLEQASGIAVTLAGGSRLQCTDVSVSGREAHLETKLLGRVSIPLPSVAHIRFETAEGQMGQAWQELTRRDADADLLVIRKDKTLDHLDGTVAGLGEKTITFLLDGEEIPVKREKVFGIIYEKPSSPGGSQEPIGEVILADSSRIRIRKIIGPARQLRATLMTGTQVELPVEELRQLDFSLGKVRFLSEMEPVEVHYTPYFDENFNYQRNRHFDGGPLRLNGRSYRKGLWIHSKTLLRYRLAGRYRRFRAIMGIDDIVGRKGIGDVHVVISGDGQTLLETDVRGGEEPRRLDLDVSNFNELQILVDFGGDLHIGDHLDLARARLIK